MSKKFGDSKVPRDKGKVEMGGERGGAGSKKRLAYKEKRRETCAVTRQGQKRRVRKNERKQTAAGAKRFRA